MMKKTPDVEKTVRAIRRHTRKKYAAEEKIRIVFEGLRYEDSIAELCRRLALSYRMDLRRSALSVISGRSLRTVKLFLIIIRYVYSRFVIHVLTT